MDRVKALEVVRLNQGRTRSYENLSRYLHEALTELAEKDKEISRLEEEIEDIKDHQLGVQKMAYNLAKIRADNAEDESAHYRTALEEIGKNLCRPRKDYAVEKDCQECRDLWICKILDTVKFNK